MTSITVPVTPGQQRPVPSRAPRALALRRGFLIASPVLAAGFAMAAGLTDPGQGADEREMYALYAAHPESLQVHTLTLHWAFAFWIVPAMLAAPYVRGRGAGLANVAAFLGFVGVSTLPGILVVDWHNSVVGQLYGVDATVAVAERMDGMWGLSALAAPGFLGFLLALPLAVLAMWRAGRVRWWGPAAMLVGFAGVHFSHFALWGTSITLVCFGILAYAFARGTSERTGDETSLGG